MLKKQFVSGFVAIAGRPNVGKSSLLNYFVGHKISITSRRPQTTRNRLLGICTYDESQIVFVDTPGIHSAEGKALNRVINKTATGSLEGVDLILMMITASGWTKEDEYVYQKAKTTGIDIILLLNKTDVLKKRDYILPVIEDISKTHSFLNIVPISVKNRYNLDTLKTLIEESLPEGPPGFPEDQITDRSQRFLAGELVREKLFRHLGEELPYISAVEISRFESDKNKVAHIDATIWVEKAGQKAIVIGKNGSTLKNIGTKARLEMERLFQCRVHLECWVKVRKGWTNDASIMRSLGYDE